MTCQIWEEVSLQLAQEREEELQFSVKDNWITPQQNNITNLVVNQALSVNSPIQSKLSHRLNPQSLAGAQLKLKIQTPPVKERKKEQVSKKKSSAASSTKKNQPQSNPAPQIQVKLPKTGTLLTGVLSCVLLSSSLVLGLKATVQFLSNSSQDGENLYPVEITRMETAQECNSGGYFWIDGQCLDYQSQGF